jgi:mono/diheme cytochrome c family protein
LKFSARTFFGSAVLLAVFMTLSMAQESGFHNAPASAAALKDPYEGKPQAVAAGRKLYGQNCAQCHGKKRQGMGPAPALDGDRVRNAKPGQLFWFITNGNLNVGMPSWANLPKQQRWQIVTFLQSAAGEKEAAK